MPAGSSAAKNCWTTHGVRIVSARETILRYIFVGFAQKSKSIRLDQRIYGQSEELATFLICRIGQVVSVLADSGSDLCEPAQGVKVGEAGERHQRHYTGNFTPTVEQGRPLGSSWPVAA